MTNKEKAAIRRAIKRVYRSTNYGESENIFSCLALEIEGNRELKEKYCQFYEKDGNLFFFLDGTHLIGSGNGFEESRGIRILLLSLFLEVGLEGIGEKYYRKSK